MKPTLANPPGAGARNGGDPGIVAQATAALGAMYAPPFTPWQVDRLRVAARTCQERGWRRIALYGAGRHTQRVIRQPWNEFDVRVVGVLDDAAAPTGQPDREIRGVRVVAPARCPSDVDAIVVSSDAHEDVLLERAHAEFGVRGRTRPGLPILAIYAGLPPETPEQLRARLIARWAVAPDDADWLIANRFERHDASLPMLPAERTEMHLRRYEFAALFSAGRRCLDVACGTGYGAGILMRAGHAQARSYVGVDIDPRAIDYAQRRHGGHQIRFLCASGAQTGLDPGCIDLAVSFETIEHMPDPKAFVAELARVLAPGGVLVLSTPNDTGPTEFHVQSFTRPALAHLLEGSFTAPAWFGQWTIGVPTIASACAGIHPLAADRSAGAAASSPPCAHELGVHAREPEHWIVAAVRR